MGMRAVWLVLAVALAGAGLAVAAAFGVVHANDPPPKQHNVPLITYGESS
ncbi:hypothetical protein [Streptantibioticus ferralitis]|uniref:Uncharacterized protein n=1 Tax=Streptantibioticus ferralitis TaxID=236510 RepID=A0ABT5YW25_9ACTN|nr:hypothetical protein [Streptantibioticus ferralitis]MDF2255775.1 hypothetical protein [Streptantibioticus ferralitis]